MLKNNLFGFTLGVYSPKTYLIFWQRGTAEDEVGCIDNRSAPDEQRSLFQLRTSSNYKCAFADTYRPGSSPELLAFDPSSILVTAGTSVTWTNRDSVSYSVSDNNQSFAFDLPAEGVRQNNVQGYRNL